MSDDSYLTAKRFEAYGGDYDALYAATSRLDERCVRLLEASRSANTTSGVGTNGGHAAAGEPAPRSSS
jgi:hypothetical protein